MAPEVSKRRLPRFSLITLLIAVNVAGVLVWANAEQGEERLQESYSTMVGSIQLAVIEQGWPFPMRIRKSVSFIDRSRVPDEVMRAYEEPQTEWSLQDLFKNVAIGLTLCALASGLTELLVRRFREAKHHDG